MTSVVVAIIMMAIVTMLVTRPGVDNVIKQLSSYTSASIKSMLGN